MKAICRALAFALGVLAAPAVAQDMPQTEEEWRAWQPDPAALEMPNLSFRESARDVERYDQFFLFHRADTDFDTALADVRECDDLSRGLVTQRFGADPRVTDAYNLSFAGAMGPIFGDLVGNPINQGIADMLYGSGELKLKRRVNLRRCMHFKGYTRFGISQSRWSVFNFDGADDDDIDEDDRQRLLALQALVASGSRPELTELGL